MKYLFLGVWGGEHDELDLCVVPLDPDYTAGILKRAEAVAEFSELPLDVAHVEFRDDVPHWYGWASPFNWDLVADYGMDADSMDDGGYAIVDLPDDFPWPDEERVELNRLCIFNGAHQVYWSCYPKHGTFNYEANAIGTSIVVNPAATVPQPA